MANALKQPAKRRAARTTSNPVETGGIDPRPVTEYTVALSVVSSSTRITITLAQPCVIRAPRWRLVNCDNGTMITAPEPVVTSNTSFYYQLGGILNSSVGFIDVPYMDTQVQNFQGGFVRPGGQWLRAPLSP